MVSFVMHMMMVLATEGTLDDDVNMLTALNMSIITKNGLAPSLMPRSSCDTCLRLAYVTGRCCPQQALKHHIIVRTRGCLLQMILLNFWHFDNAA